MIRKLFATLAITIGLLTAAPTANAVVGPVTPNPNSPIQPPTGTAIHHPSVSLGLHLGWYKQWHLPPMTFGTYPKIHHLP